MAIINSMGVGRARKSMGNVTYRTVRGRTIGSQKRGAGQTGATTRGMSGNVRKPLFAMINMYMQAHASDIQVSFNKSKYGSQRNYFFTQNYKGFSSALLALAQSASISGVLPDLTEIEAAVVSYVETNPESIYRVKLQGFEIKYLTSAWSSDDNPVSGGAQDGLGVGTAQTKSGGSDSGYTYDAPTTFSLSFHAGAKVVRDAGTVTIKGAAIPAGLSAGVIQYLTSGGTPLSPAVVVTDVVSTAGSVTFTSPALSESQNVLAVQLGSIFCRLSSAYVRTGGGDNPLG